MFELDAEAFVSAVASLNNLRTIIRSRREAHADEVAKPLTDTVAGDVETHFDLLREQFKALQADFALLALNRAQARIGKAIGQRLTYSELADCIDDITRRVRDELNARLIVVIETKRADLYRAQEPLFGTEVFDVFPDASTDIEEAGKCLSLQRGTACVFHLMRAMEISVRAIATKIGVSVLDKNDQFERWGVILSNVKAAIPSLPRDQQDEWTQAHNLLWGVNKASRNSTMHPATFYTSEQAGEVFDAVRGFMRHLAPLV